MTLLYKETKDFPREEVYGLTSQMRRCAVSIPSNIAEGHGRSTRKEYLRYLEVALGSLRELQTQIVIARNLEYFDADPHAKLSNLTLELERMLTSLQRSLRKTTS